MQLYLKLQMEVQHGLQEIQDYLPEISMGSQHLIHLPAGVEQ